MIYYSYVMGIDESIFKLEKFGFNIERDGIDNYTVTFNKELAALQIPLSSAS